VRHQLLYGAGPRRDTEPPDRLLPSFSHERLSAVPAGVSAWLRSANAQEVQNMGPRSTIDPREERLAALEELGIEEKALIYDEAGDKLSVSDDETAIKDFYARAFQEWSLGNVEGTAEEIFDAVTFLLDED
jgi:hypothetical protein